MGYKVMNECEDLDNIIEIETAYTEGFRAGKKAAVYEFIDRLKAKSAVPNIGGVTHYVVTKHQLEVIKKLVLEGK